MASTIQIKRSTGTSAPSSLAKGEMGWADHGSGGAAGNLYIGCLLYTSDAADE